MKTLVNIFLKPIYKKILNIINISYVDHKYKRFGREGDGGYVLPINIIEQNLKENFAVLTFVHILPYYLYILHLHHHNNLSF